MDVVIRRNTTTSPLASGALSTAPRQTIASTNREDAFPVLWGMVVVEGGRGALVFPGSAAVPDADGESALSSRGVSLLGCLNNWHFSRVKRVCGESGRVVALLGERVLWFLLVSLLFRWSIRHSRFPPATCQPLTLLRLEQWCTSGVRACSAALHETRGGMRRIV